MLNVTKMSRNKLYFFYINYIFYIDIGNYVGTYKKLFYYIIPNQCVQEALSDYSCLQNRYNLHLYIFVEFVSGIFTCEVHNFYQSTKYVKRTSNVKVF